MYFATATKTSQSQIVGRGLTYRQRHRAFAAIAAVAAAGGFLLGGCSLYFVLYLRPSINFPPLHTHALPTTISHWTPPSDTPFIPGTSIPKIIHQTWANQNLSTVPGSGLGQTETFFRHNPTTLYHFWSDAECFELVESYPPHIQEAYAALPKGAMRADLIRYMILHKIGGVYADVDTECLQPIDVWANATDGDAPIGGLIGMENDYASLDEWKGSDMPRFLGIAQWTFAFAPAHPLMSHAVTACAEKVLWAASNPGLIDKLGYHLCGPPLLTDVANDYVTAWGRKLADFHRTEGETIGNVKILPITAFTPWRWGQGARGRDDPASFVFHKNMFTWRAESEKQGI